MKYRLLYFPFVIILSLLDQISKFFVYQYLPLFNSLEVVSFLSITHIHNYGVAFSMFSNSTNLFDIVLILFSIVAMLFLVSTLINSPNTYRGFYWSLVLILAGAMGNFIDRIYHGFVIDFISVFSFPIFNFADMFIFIGAIGFIFFDYIFNKNLKKG